MDARVALVLSLTGNSTESSEQSSTPATDEDGVSIWLIVGAVLLAILLVMLVLALVRKCCQKKNSLEDDSLKEKLVKSSIPKVTHMDPFAV